MHCPLAWRLNHNPNHGNGEDHPLLLRNTRSERSNNQRGGQRFVRDNWSKLVLGLAACAVVAVVGAVTLGQSEVTRIAEGGSSFVKASTDLTNAASNEPKLHPRDLAGGTYTPRTKEIRDETPRLGRPTVAKPESSGQHIPTILDFTVTNFYHERDGKPGALIPWLQGVKLAEPHRDTTLRVINPREGHTYIWEIREHAVGDEHVSERRTPTTVCGDEVIVHFKRLDWNFVSLTEVKDSTGYAVREHLDKVMVKYVRREIRTLTDEDREELFDAMLVLYTAHVRGGDGTAQELYGDDFTDIWAINRLHFKASSPYLCDHFHEGLGFLTSHVLLTNTFEYSLQRVNPALTVPYWDYTIETSSSSENLDMVEPQAASPILQSSWFGSTDPADSMVKDGRWAYTKIPKVEAGNPSHLDSDAWGNLRSDWVLNNRPYLTRGVGEICGSIRPTTGFPWPTCEHHYELSTMYNSFYSWLYFSMVDPHGGVHIWLGGSQDCTETFETIASLVGDNIADTLAPYAFLYRKTLFRDSYYRCESNADPDATANELLTDGACGCLDYDLEAGDDYIQIRDVLPGLADLIDAFDDDTQREVVNCFCNRPMNDGDHLQSSSSLDPSFWVVHPTIERLWHFKQLTGTMNDTHWPDDDISYVDRDGNMVEEVTNTNAPDCLGHRGKDVFPFGLDTDEGNCTIRTGIRGDNDGDNTLTNREVLAVLDPRINELDYIYDTFEWDHCMIDGYDMNDAWMSGTDPASHVKQPLYKKSGPRHMPWKVFRDLRET